MRRVLALVVVVFIAGCNVVAAGTERYRQESSAMEPGIEAGEVVTAQVIDPEQYEPQRGDVIVFRAPAVWAELAGRNVISRVIAVGGETVACCDDQGRVTVDGAGLDEPYLGDNAPLSLPPGECGSRRFGPVAVPAGHVFVMSDSRLISVDSVCMGPVPADAIIATVDL